VCIYVLNGMQVKEISLMHMHPLRFRLLDWKRKIYRYLRDRSLPHKSVLSYLPGCGHKRTRQSRDRIDCFVARAIILRPKAARDKGVGAVLCINTRRIAKSVQVTHVTISLCGVRARALSF